MKIKKMKLLGLFFILASVFIVKTSFNPVCVQAMEDDLINNLNRLADNSISNKTTECATEYDNKHATDDRNNIINNIYANDKILKGFFYLGDNVFISDETFREFAEVSKLNCKDKNQVFSIGVQTKDNLNFESKKKAKLSIYNSIENYDYSTQEVQNDSEIIFEFKENNNVKHFKISVDYILRNGANLLCKWINNTLPRGVKKSFNDYIKNRNNEFFYISNKLKSYLIDKMFDVTQAKIEKYQIPTNFKYMCLSFNTCNCCLVFSIDFPKSQNSEICTHYFYKINANDKIQYAYLGSVSCDLKSSKPFYDEKRALNSCLFYCGCLKNYDDD